MEADKPLNDLQAIVENQLGSNEAKLRGADIIKS